MNDNFFVSSVAPLLTAGLFFLLVMVLPLVVYAQGNSFQEGYWNLYGHAVDSGLPDFETPTSIFQQIINFLLGLVGVLAILSLIYGGAKMIVGFGNEEQAASAKKIIMWSIIGLLVVVLAWVIITTVVGFIR